jgi:hypothetical protein
MRLIYPINQSDVSYSKPVIGSGSDSGSQIWISLIYIPPLTDSIAIFR